MKLAITGPHCSGKSTVLKAVAEKSVGSGIEFVLNKTRPPVDYSSSLQLAADPLGEIKVSAHMACSIIQKEIVYGLRYDKLFFDRCIIDQIIYPAVILGSFDRVPSALVGIVEDWITSSPYEQVFIMPRNEELLQQHGTKDRSLDFLRRVDEAYHSLPQKLGLRVTNLPQKQEEQIQTVLKYLKSGI